jgi:hypothetical protein
MDPSTWEGAAYQMGNSLRTWEAHYNPQQRMRAMQGAVDTNDVFTQRVREAQPAVDPIMMVGGRKRKRN